MTAFRKFSPFISESEREVWSWIDTKPADIIAASPEECYRMAWGAAGLSISCGDMTDILWRLRYRPEGIGPIPTPGTPRDMMAQFRLRLTLTKGGSDDGEPGN